ncbi:patatin-like phospholipase family protein [Cryomorphaceae bacterium]|nr:patatin-like phospholipase family protein [Cryomorphaceae bacterium]
MTQKPRIRIQWGRFFPIQLLALHFKRSLILLLFWILLFGFVTKLFAQSYGIPLLFLAPEYMGTVGWLSFFLLGVFTGLFFMAFHVSTYIYYSHKFTFLATLQQPLYRFSINNSLLPFSFSLVYLYFSYQYQTGEEQIAPLKALLHLFAWIFGSVVSISITFTYFFNANRNVFRGLEQSLNRPLNLLVKRDRDTSSLSEHTKTQYYLRNFFTLRIVRSTDHYPKGTLIRILDKHHRNAALFILVIFLVILGFGILREQEWANIPAAGSIFLLFTMYLMLTAVLHSWFRSWYAFGVAVVLICIQWLSHYPLFEKVNHAFGLDYKAAPAPYRFEDLVPLTTDSIYTYDRNLELQALQGWHAQTRKTKPKLIIVNTSGGGLRSALFTFEMMHVLDSVTEGAFFKQTRLITGASGGMMGAAYYRGLKHEDSLDSVSIDLLQDCLSTDMLNPIVFGLVTNDLFFNTLHWRTGNQRYNKDRGYSFEQALHRNTLGILDVPLSYYRNPELSGSIPKMVFSPIIVNDGRRLNISSSPTSYLSLVGPNNERPEYHDGIEFSRFFEALRADSLRFSTAIRMSASFPYITPLINLPSKPAMELIDAGARDNNGFELSMRYAYHFNEWLNRFTSGIVFVRLRSDGLNDARIRDEHKRGVFENLFNPVSGVVKSFDNMQDFNQSQLLLLADEWCNVPIDVIEFNLFEEEEAVSLSWHLSTSEKAQVRSSIFSEANSAKTKELIQLLD